MIVQIIMTTKNTMYAHPQTRILVTFLTNNVLKIERIKNSTLKPPSLISFS